MRVAILGAGGFIGGRIFERWQRPGPYAPRAVVRTSASLARVARFDTPDWRLADARDERALTEAFAGCEVVVHSIVGPERTIIDAVAPVYRAAQQAGVRRLVYLSSASVHGQNPPPGTTEESPLHLRHVLGYNNAKVEAERRLQTLAASGGVEVVVLRPGIVWGPRSRWVYDVADALRAGAATWIDGGRGICHSVYVDNVVHAVERAIATPGISREAFFIGDTEPMTWRDLYLGLARPLGFDESAFREALPAPVPRRTWRDRVGAFKGTGFAQRVLVAIPSRVKETVKGALRGWQGAPPIDGSALPDVSAALVASLEMTELFRCSARLSHAKAQRLLGYRPPVSFPQGLDQCVRWLAELGYVASAVNRP